MKHTSAILKEEKNMLWGKGLLAVDTPKSLLRAVFYYNRKWLFEGWEGTLSPECVSNCSSQ